MSFTIGGSVLSGMIEGIVTNIATALGKKAEGKAEDYLEGKMFGMGINDEVLFNNACTYALEKDWITKKDLLRVLRIINSYSNSRQARIIRVIGHGEEAVKEVIPGEEKDGKKSKPKEINYKINRNGARVMAMLGKMTKKQIMDYLEATGSSKDSFDDFKKKASKAVADSTRGFTTDSENFFARETPAQRRVRMMRESGEI